MSTAASAATGKPGKHSNVIVWFRDNLRVHDNYVLSEASLSYSHDIDHTSRQSHPYKAISSSTASATGKAADLSKLATSKESEKGKFLCVYCFDDRHFKTTSLGSQKTGIHRSKFLIQSVQNLRDNLRKHGSDLYVAKGRPEDVIPTLIVQMNEKTSADITGM